MASVSEEDASMLVSEDEEDFMDSVSTQSSSPRFENRDIKLNDNQPPDCDFESFVMLSTDRQSPFEADSEMSQGKHHNVDEKNSEQYAPATKTSASECSTEEKTEEKPISVKSMINKFGGGVKATASDVFSKPKATLPTSGHKKPHDKTFAAVDDGGIHLHEKGTGSSEKDGSCILTADSSVDSELCTKLTEIDPDNNGLMRNTRTAQGKCFKITTEVGNQENEAEVSWQESFKDRSETLDGQAVPAVLPGDSVERILETHVPGEQEDNWKVEEEGDINCEEPHADLEDSISLPGSFTSSSSRQEEQKDNWKAEQDDDINYEDLSINLPEEDLSLNLPQTICSETGVFVSPAGTFPQASFQENLPEVQEPVHRMSPSEMCESQKRERYLQSPSELKPIPSHQNQHQISGAQQYYIPSKDTTHHFVPKECKGSSPGHEQIRMQQVGIQEQHQKSPRREQTPAHLQVTGFPRETSPAAYFRQQGVPDNPVPQSKCAGSPPGPHQSKSANNDSATVRVDGVDENMELDLIKLYFESAKSGGGDVISVEDYRSEGYVLVMFEDTEAAENVTHRPHTVGKKSLIASLHKVQSPEEKSPAQSCTVEVRGGSIVEKEELLQLYFENSKKSGGGPIKSFRMDAESSVAFITFEDETAVAEVLSRSHSLTGVSLSVTPHRPSRTIRVRGLKKNTSTDLLEMYFESKRAGGNEVEKVVLNDGKGEALVTFKDESAVHDVLQKEHVIGGTKVTVNLHEGATKASASETEQMMSKESCTVEVCGLSKQTSEETVVFYFENKRRSGGGPIQEIKRDLQHGRALITFEDHEAVKRVLEKKHTIDGKELQVNVYIPPTDRVVSSYDRCDDQELNSVVIDGLGKSTSKDTLWNYFENNRRSGGGPVTDVRFDDKRGVVYITFEHDADASNVASRKHKLDGKEVTVNIYRPPEMMKDRVVLTELEDVSSVDELLNFVEAKTGEDVSSILFGNDGEAAVVIFENVIDFHEVQSALTKKLFKGRTLVVEPVPVSATVLVQNLPQNPPSSTDMLSNYFENKRRSGGGDVTNVELGDHGKYALITFADAKDAEAVTKRKHIINEHQVDVTLYCECLGIRGGELEPNVRLPEPAALSESTQVKISAIKMAPRVMKSLISLLEEQNAHLSMAGLPEEICLTCSLTPETEGVRQLVKSWEEKVTGALDSYLKSVEMEELSVSEEEYAEVTEQLKEVSEHAEIDINFDPQRSILIIIWVGEDKREITKEVKKIIEGAQVNVKRKHEVKKEQMKIPKGKILLLKTHLTNTREKFPDLSIHFDDENECIEFTGVGEVITEMKLIISDFMNNMTCNSHIWDSQLISQLFAFPKAREMFERECMKQDQDGAVVILPGGFEVYSFDEILAEKMLLAGRKSVQRRVVKFEDGMEDIIKLERWAQMKESVLEANKELMVMDEDKTALTIVSLNTNINTCIQQLKSFLDENFIQEDTLTVAKPFKTLFQKYFWKNFERKRAEDKRIRLDLMNLNEDDDRVVIKGNASAIQEAKAVAVSFIRSLKCTAKTVKKPLFDQFLQSSDWKLVREEIEQNLMCKILMPEDKFDCFFSSYDSDYRQFGETSYLPEDVDEIPDVRQYDANAFSATSLPAGGKGRRSFGSTKFQADIKIKVPATTPKLIKPPRPRIYLSIMSDITKEEHDVLVNSASASLHLNHGQVSTALLTVGGDTIQAECTQQYPQGIQPGELAITSGGKLFCKNIFHCCLPEKKDEQQMKDILTKTMMKCLSEADTRGHRSIGFPALGAGNLGYPSDLVAETMFQATVDFGLKNPQCKLSDVFFILHKKDTQNRNAFEEENERWRQDNTQEEEVTQEDEEDISQRNPDAMGTKRWLFFNETAKTVKLMFVTQDAVTMDKAEEELMNHYRKTIVVSQFDVPDLERWQEDFINDLVNGCKVALVDLTINYDLGRLKLEGLREKVDSVPVNIIMKQAGDRIQEDKLAHLMAKQIRWYFVEVYQADEELLEYDVRTSYRIERAYRDGKHKEFIFDDQNQAYVVDFTKMEEKPENPMVADEVTL
ncbi:uncharacterized protein LOC112563487 isoform X3 [Pomacea canaliculata]|uniref:uncharacterized protein LOC112563487 isoform X3 n=1 Tax=Pomacea canaliculata TaxID=400727 RepID=UPI000D72A8CF|nr:uncharacterized protein LOC112563487 isoform X3 [Pomacea canaliculata]